MLYGQSIKQCQQDTCIAQRGSTAQRFGNARKRDTLSSKNSKFDGTRRPSHAYSGAADMRVAAKQWERLWYQR